jgi:hypothetical protein
MSDQSVDWTYFTGSSSYLSSLSTANFFDCTDQNPFAFFRMLSVLFVVFLVMYAILFLVCRPILRFSIANVREHYLSLALDDSWMFSSSNF